MSDLQVWRSLFYSGGMGLLPFRLKVGDFIIAIVIIAIAAVNLALFTFKSSDNISAVIIKDGKAIRTINLSSLTKKETVQFDDKYKIVITAEKGRIRFAKANCPDKVCVQTGWISKAGQSAACLPARIIIKIIAGDKNTDSIITKDNNTDMDIKLK